MASETGLGRVLVADDDDRSREITRLVLERAGWRVVEARDGVDAICRHADDPDAIDIVLLDLVHPGLSGLGALRVMRLRSPRLPAVYASGVASPALVAEMRALAGVTFVAKPYQMADLLTHLVATRAQTERKG